MNTSVKHVDFLDRLRGVAIIAVLLFHTLSTVFGYDVLPWGGWFRDFSVPVSFLCFLPLSIANVGVAIFFVISGFCIHMSFQQQGQRWGSFVIRRIFRIYPAYLAALIFFALFYMHHFQLGLMSQQVWTQLLTHFFLIHNYQTTTIGTINGSFWSMAVEAQLYLIYPVLLFLVGKLGWRRTLTLLAGIEICIRGTAGIMETLDATNTSAGHVSWLFSISPLGYWFSWAIGAAIADAFLNQQPLPFSKSSLVLWPVLATVSYFVKPLDGFRFLLFAVMTATLVSRLLARGKSEIKTPVPAFAMVQKIGLWSYSLYLLHQPLLNFYSYAIQRIFPAELRAAPIAFGLIVLTWLVVIPLSIFWYQIFEVPGLALGKRIIQRLDARHRGISAPVGIGKIAQTTVPTRRYGLRICALLVLAVGSFMVGAKLVPRDPTANNNLAWTLATSPEANHRNGARAVELAEEACQQTQYKQTIMVGTLAAAYAEAGRFDQAILTAQAACELAAKNGETNVLQRNQELLSLYQRHQPYRDQPVKTPK